MTSPALPLPKDLNWMHNLIQGVTETTWDQLTNDAKGPDAGANDALNFIDGQLSPPTSAKRPGEIQRAIKHLLQMFGVAEIAVRLNGSEETYFFSRNRYPSKDHALKFRELRRFSADIIGPDSMVYPSGFQGGTSYIEDGKEKDLLVLFSKSVVKLSYPTPDQSKCMAFFPVDETEGKAIQKAIESHLWATKSDALVKYRILANLVTIILAPVLKNMMRYSRFAMSTALARCFTESRYQLSYPWKRGSEVPTTTLVLDIRKSTFAMSFALSERDFADWMSFTIRMLRRISDKYSAIFDKFTGDGVMIHFAATEGRADLSRKGEATALDEFMAIPSSRDYDEIRSTLVQDFSGDYVRHPEALQAGWQANERRLLMAYCCAWEMMYAMNRHTQRLRSILTRGHGGLGSTVGIGIGSSTWSLDRDGNPIVVGPGVVGACRAVDSGAPGALVVSPTIVKRLAAAGLHCDRDWSKIPTSKPDVAHDEEYYAITKASSKLQVQEAQAIADVERDYEIFMAEGL